MLVMMLFIGCQRSDSRTTVVQSGSGYAIWPFVIIFVVICLMGSAGSSDGSEVGGSLNGASAVRRFNHRQLPHRINVLDPIDGGSTPSPMGRPGSKRSSAPVPRPSGGHTVKVPTTVVPLGGHTVRDPSTVPPTNWHKFLENEDESEEVDAGDTLEHLRFVSVSMARFRQALKHARTYHDVWRVFLDSKVPVQPEDIDELLLYKSIGVDNLFRMSSRQLSDSETDTQFTEYELATKHYQEMSEKSDCRNPTPHLVHINRDLSFHNTFYLPECTVLHRCMKESGCCDSQSECGVKTSQVVYRFFWEVPFLEGMVQPEPRVKPLKLVNHTECECVPFKYTRCLRCPTPFRLELDSDSCTCSCEVDEEIEDDDNDPCLQASSGRRRLDKSQIDCIREGDCELPKCTNGDLDLDTAYCPCLDDDTDCSEEQLRSGPRQVDVERRENENSTSETSDDGILHSDDEENDSNIMDNNNNQNNNNGNNNNNNDNRLFEESNFVDENERDFNDKSESRIEDGNEFELYNMAN